PQSARECVDELLADWGRAFKSGEEAKARRDLDLARAIGAALARLGDRMVADAVGAIDRAQAEGAGSHRLSDLAVRHEAYGGGVVLRASSFQQAGEQMARARTTLARAGSPFAAWADFQLALCDYQHSRYDAVGPRLKQLLAAAEAGRYLALRAVSLRL